jgi:hypothetical protein
MIASLTSSPWLIVGLLAALLVLYWAYDEADDADDNAELAAGVGSRARDATVGSARATRMGVIGLAGLGATLGMEALQLAAGLNEIVGGVPVIVGHVVGGGLAWLGITGVLTPMQWGWAFVSTTIIALVLRFTTDTEAA